MHAVRGNPTISDEDVFAAVQDHLFSDVVWSNPDAEAAFNQLIRGGHGLIWVRNKLSRISVRATDRAIVRRDKEAQIADEARVREHRPPQNDAELAAAARERLLKHFSSWRYLNWFIPWANCRVSELPYDQFPRLLEELQTNIRGTERRISVYEDVYKTLGEAGASSVSDLADMLGASVSEESTEETG